MSDLLSAKQVIDLLKIDRTTLYRMIRENRIKGIKVGSQWRFRKSIVDNLLHPSSNQSRKTAGDILPMHCVQPIQEVFSDMIQVAVLTTDTEGTPISKPSNSSRFCEMILASPKGKQACITCWKDIEFTPQEQPHFVTCHAGLQYSGANIKMEGKIIAKLITGQFYNTPPDFESTKKHIIQLANRYELNEKKLINAAREIKVIDSRIAQFLGQWMEKVAKTFATLGNERKELMSRLKSIAEISKL